VGVDNEPGLCELDAYILYQPLRYGKVGDITGVNENRLLGSIYEVIRIQVSPFDKEKVLHNFNGAHVVCYRYLSRVFVVTSFRAGGFSS